MKIRINFLLAVSLFLLSLQSFAGNILTSTVVEKSDLSSGLQLDVEDLSYADELTDPSAYSVIRRAKLHLSYTRDQQTDLEHHYWRYEVGYTELVSGTSGTLAIQFNGHDADFEHLYEQLAIFNTNSHVSQVAINAVKAWVSNTPIDASNLSAATYIANPANSTDLPEDISLTLSIETERYYDFDLGTKVPLFFNGYSPTEGIDLGWGYTPGAEEYDLEWVFVDVYDLGVPVATEIFSYKEPTRITTTSNTYQIPPMASEALVYFRVRPRGKNYVGAWSYNSDLTATVVPGNMLYQHITGFESNKNWQYTISFAEDGKSKSVLNYMDGSMRSKQTLTKLSTEDVFVVGVNRYDYEGRPSVSILPSAIDNYGGQNNYSYKEKMNQVANGDMFDKAHFDTDIGNTANSNRLIAANNGAGEYYSGNNPFTNSMNRDYIPNAQGMPYAQTEFLKDGTGRVKRTSGVGTNHALGSGHETFYYYSSPNATELIRMFGENVGNVKHYKKNYVIDPNGQISASYLDQEGRTIATCLVGEAPNNLDALPGTTQEIVTVDLNEDNELVNDVDNGIISRSESVVFNYMPQTYNFEYELETGVIAHTTITDGTTSNMFCANCSYVLEIKVLNPDGSLHNLAYTDPVTGATTATITQQYTNNQAAVCPGTQYSLTAAPITFSLTTDANSPVGEYTVIKVLRVDEEAMQTQLDLELAYIDDPNTTSVFVPNLSDLVMQYTQDIDFSNCNMEPCDEQATGGTKTFTPTPCIPVDEVPSPSDDLNINSCEVLLERLKADVSLGGWLFESPWLEEALLELSADPNDPAYIPHSTRGDLIVNWDPAFVDKLVTKHREFCHYEKCVATEAINDYSNQMALVTSMNDPAASSYLNPTTNGDPILALDPSFHNKIVNEYIEISPNNYQSLLTYVSVPNTVNHPGITPATEIDDFLYPNIATPTGEQIWQRYYGFYNAERLQIIENHYTCTYYADDHSIFRDPFAPIVWNVDDECEDICELNVENWLSSIANNCENLTAGQLSTIESHLVNYCATTCDGTNPNGVLIAELLGNNADLNAIQGILNTAGCGTAQVLENLAQPEPCTVEVTLNNVAIETASLTQASLDWNVFVNELLAIPNLAMDVEYSLTNTSHFPFFSGILSANYGSFADKVKILSGPVQNRIVFLNGTTEVAVNNHFNCMTNNDGDYISLLDLTAVVDLEPNLTFTDGVDPTFGITANYDNGTTVEEIYIQASGGCPNYYPTTAGIGFSKVLNNQTSLSINQTNQTIVTCDEWNENDNIFSTDITIADIEQDCENELRELATLAANEEFERLKNEFIEEYWAAVYDQCMRSPLEESFHYEYKAKEYQYTLFYFDQAGSLVQTVPPLGVNLVPVTHFTNGVWDGTNPDHELKTTYQYNSLGQMIAQNTPDAGESKFFYNDNQQLRFSQNAQQAVDGNYSYTKYDKHGRTVEAGQVSLAQVPTEEQLNDNTFPTTAIEQVTASYYDESNHSVANFTSENARGRIASVAYNEDGAPTSTEFNHATHYSYDIHGNVKELVQENKNIKFSKQQLKKMAYTYDLISGNVNEVIYQEGELDEFRHRYSYDADNRLTKAETSKDGEIWKADAKYFYYLHGPLARVELGHDKVAANDFTYTIQGWLKAVNSTVLRSHRDMGRDGNNVANNQNRFVGQDAFAYTLGYFNWDYMSIGNTDFMAYNTHIISPVGNDLYNGNISHMTTTMKDEQENRLAIHGNSYRYDQLNRIKSMKVYTNDGFLTNSGVNSWYGATRKNVVNGMGDYETNYSYDKNGNLTSLTRKTKTEAANGNNNNLDQFNYYYYNTGTGDLQNRLSYVKDVNDATADYGDIKGWQPFQNYKYNEIGQLTEDEQENIDKIVWTVSGKVKEIKRDNVVGLKDVSFMYDAMGNRIGKISKPRDAQGNLLGEKDWVYSHYVLDASGNTMAVYEEEFSDWTSQNEYVSLTTLKEQMLYGSSRLGVQNVNKVIYGARFSDPCYTTNGVFSKVVGPGESIQGECEVIITDEVNINPQSINHLKYIAGEKSYELSNHLGNVLAVITDKKIGVESTTISGDLAYYQSDVVSYSDYYPFGMLQPYRHGGEYRYMFNGIEADNEIKGLGNSIAYQYRVYDPRLGRFFALDPLNQFHSNYVGAGNKPIWGREADGRYWHIVLGGAVGAVWNGVVNWNKYDGEKWWSSVGLGAASGAVSAANPSLTGVAFAAENFLDQYWINDKELDEVDYWQVAISGGFAGVGSLLGRKFLSPYISKILSKLNFDFSRFGRQYVSSGPIYGIEYIKYPWYYRTPFNEGISSTLGTFGSNYVMYKANDGVNNILEEILPPLMRVESNKAQPIVYDYPQNELEIPKESPSSNSNGEDLQILRPENEGNNNNVEFKVNTIKNKL
ncbi:MAG: hypothetical protein N4A35_01140 [Flavobacteriales bacterium]|jgi:RHS repeat-associated protein|nr:hypothetical protein [Flavobacteriales bacterium]